MLTFHLQMGMVAENSLSWTPLTLGLYHEANQGVIFHTSTCQSHRGNLSRKEDWFLGSMIQTKVKQEQGRVDIDSFYILFLKKTFLLATVLRTVKVIAVEAHLMGL